MFLKGYDNRASHTQRTQVRLERRSKSSTTVGAGTKATRVSSGLSQRCEIDDAVDKLYRAAPFTGDRCRVEHLFGLYERLVAPLAAAAPRPRKRRSTKGV